MLPPGDQAARSAAASAAPAAAAASGDAAVTSDPGPADGRTDGGAGGTSFPGGPQREPRPGLCDITGGGAAAERCSRAVPRGLGGGAAAQRAGAPKCCNYSWGGGGGVHLMCLKEY